MRKIPTIFQRARDRHWEPGAKIEIIMPGDRPVIPEPTPGCEWVFAGEGLLPRSWTERT